MIHNNNVNNAIIIITYRTIPTGSKIKKSEKRKLRYGYKIWRATVTLYRTIHPQKKMVYLRS